MKITKKELERLIQEELEKNIEEGFFTKMIGKGVDKLKGAFKGKDWEKEAEATAEKPEDGEDVDVSDLNGPPKPEDAEPDTVSASPQAAKAKDLFVQTARQFFNSIIMGATRQAIMRLIDSGANADQARLQRARAQRGLNEAQASSSRGKAFLLTNALMKAVDAMLNSITPEEFAEVFANVAQEKLKNDPKALKQALKSFRMAESVQQEAFDQISGSQNTAGLTVSPTFTAQLSQLMKKKNIDATKIVKAAMSMSSPEKLGLKGKEPQMLMGQMIKVLNRILQYNLKNPTNASKPEPAQPEPAQPTNNISDGSVYPDPSEMEIMEEAKRWKQLAGILKD